MNLLRKLKLQKYRTGSRFASAAPATADWNTKFAGVLRFQPVRLFYWPAYSNPYQQLFYGADTPQFVASASRIETALSELKKSPDIRIVFHLHWLNFLFSRKGSNEARSTARDFVETARAFRDLGGVLIWTVHNLSEHDREGEQIEKEVREDILKLAQIVFVHGEAAKKEVLASFPKARNKIRVIPHGSYISYYPDHVSRDSSRDALGIHPKTTAFLCLGLVRMYKGLDKLSRTVERIPSANLIVAGQILDKDKNELKGTAHLFNCNTKTLFFQGWVEKEDVQRYMNAADYAVLPYLKSLTSGAAILAMSFGVPVIAPAMGPFADLVQDGVNGFLFHPEREGAILETLLRAQRTSPEDQALLRARAFETASGLTWSAARLGLFQALNEI